MTGPLWARWVLAALFGVMAARYLYSPPLPAWRALRPTCGDRGWSHALMATGMCVMFLPVAVPVPPLLWSAVFAVNTLWLASRVLTSPERALLVEPALCAAVMTAMFLVMPSSGVAGSIGPTGSAVSHAGHLAMVDPGLAAAGWVAAAGFLALAVRSGVRIATVGGPATAAGGPPVAAGSGAADGLPMRLVMAMGMAYMLLTML